MYRIIFATYIDADALQEAEFGLGLNGLEHCVVNPDDLTITIASINCPDHATWLELLALDNADPDGLLGLTRYAVIQVF